MPCIDLTLKYVRLSETKYREIFMKNSIISGKVKYPVYEMNCSQLSTKHVTTRYHLPFLNVERIGKLFILAICSEACPVLFCFFFPSVYLYQAFIIPLSRGTLIGKNLGIKKKIVFCWQLRCYLQIK